MKINFNNFTDILNMHKYVIRIKDIQRKEERVRKIRDLIGGSAMDRVDKQKALFQMFGLEF